MTPNPWRVAASFVVVLAAASLLAGCGRRGPLEPPPSAAVLSTDEQGNVVGASPPRDRPFVLDPLIQ
ncbi:MAG: hypothetical protein BroJett030_13770 [Alphaproteobacteria bacterium]|nr:MAG: hypothetical protein BroJett030_13770 [Alphaproteobacteria bacterium]